MQMLQRTVCFLFCQSDPRWLFKQIGQTITPARVPYCSCHILPERTIMFKRNIEHESLANTSEQKVHKHKQSRWEAIYTTLPLMNKTTLTLANSSYWNRLTNCVNFQQQLGAHLLQRNLYIIFEINIIYIKRFITYFEYAYFYTVHLNRLLHKSGIHKHFNDLEILFWGIKYVTFRGFITIYIRQYFVRDIPKRLFPAVLNVLKKN